MANPALPRKAANKREGRLATTLMFMIGTLVFREPFGRTRIVATMLVAAGIVLLNAG